ncbi:hypothetical protein BpHYR1_013456 [Brachionus plicatilis]|uniref:Uncharacterized protein n=1 Tax=Brachionus plicatilis TaxID=10195 RepID=A0A3M7QUG8_BRAPC|nr:hypothetical protein BpHYR1_013456 [Brachionus plicatilis]
MTIKHSDSHFLASIRRIEHLRINTCFPDMHFMLDSILDQQLGKIGAHCQIVVSQIQKSSPQFLVYPKTKGRNKRLNVEWDVVV